MTTDTLSPSAEEETIAAPFEKLPKLNLPPKPVLARATIADIPPPSSFSASSSDAVLAALSPPAAATTAVTEPPFMATNSESTSPPTALTQVVAPSKKPEFTETPTPHQQRASLSLPLATMAFVVALLGLIIQLLAFLHFF